MFHARRLVLWAGICMVLTMAAAYAQAQREPFPGRLPGDAPPVIGAWFWRDALFEAEGYRRYIDMYRDHTVYNLLTSSCRRPGYEITHPEVHRILKEAVDYAHQFGMGVAFELDARLARTAFKEAYPDEQQEMLRLRTAEVSATEAVTIRVAPEILRDHMNSRTTPYQPLSSRLVRAWSLVKGQPGAVRDITGQCTVKSATDEAIEVEVAPEANAEPGRIACVAVAFTLFTPDVFAPHLLDFERSLVEQYADVPLAGIMKDEWGFPPCHGGNPDKNDYWYSEARAKAYAEQTGGRDLVRDCLLMRIPEEGREAERQKAINHFLAMSRERNVLIEDHYYRLAKEFFGPDAAVVTHPTWTPYPGVSEFKKNGLDWWAATRDLAQTDEFTPFCARTALAKKWESPVWYNQFYAKTTKPYEFSVWSHALGGGRINYHPLYPYEGEGDRDIELLRSNYVLGEARIRLLNLISSSPVDCPVAVIFGHACAMNWAGPAYNDVGMAITDALWRAGYFADLIPTSELHAGALRINEQGSIQYGTQAYEAVALYHPEFEFPKTAKFLTRAAVEGGTALFRVGDWTRDFDAQPFEGNAALPPEMAVAETAADCAARIIAELEDREIEPHSPATSLIRDSKSPGYAAPGRKGHLRLTDGTRIMLAGEEDAGGDPVQAKFTFGDQTIEIDATGVAAARLAKDGRIEGLVAGGLKHLAAPGIDVTLPGTADIALWQDEDGVLHGIVQGADISLPGALEQLAQDWRHFPAPIPVQ